MIIIFTFLLLIAMTQCVYFMGKIISAYNLKKLLFYILYFCLNNLLVYHLANLLINSI